MKIIKDLIQNGNVKRVVLIMCISALFAVSGWMFIQVRDLPATTVTKEEVAIEVNELRAERTELYNMLNKRLDRLDSGVYRLEDRMDDIMMKLLEINRWAEKNGG